MNSSNIVIVVIILLLVGAGALWYTTMGPGAAPTPATVNVNSTSNTTSDTSNSTTTGSGVTTSVGVEVSTVPTTATVTYTTNGFSPSNVTIKKGGTVTWVNEGTGEMWVGSAMHPTHSGYDGTTLAAHCDDAASTSFDQCENGDNYSFTFDKVGKWNYHNHSRSSHFGSVTVVE